VVVGAVVVVVVVGAVVVVVVVGAVDSATAATVVETDSSVVAANVVDDSAAPEVSEAAEHAPRAIPTDTTITRPLVLPNTTNPRS
jgi:hypothetical protein